MTSLRNAGQWALLAAVSIPLSWALQLADFPAAFLLGPMIAGVAFGLRGASVRVPKQGFAAAQALIGCMVARAFTPSILASLARDWAVMLCVVAASLAAGGIVGWVLTKRGTLPGVTAAWGSSPGGAAAMTAMAGEYGADVRLVAFMQYLRVFIVVLTASAVSRLLMGAQAQAHPAAPFDLGFSEPPLPVILTLAVALGAAWAGRRLRIPAGAMLGPLLAGAALNSAGIVHITLPQWVMVVAYALLGWHIGLRFTPGVIRHALRAIPALLLATFLLIGLCGLSAWMLTALAHVDALTAYLATSPGGLDSVAIIAVGSGSDIPFVMALQTMRLFAVVLTGPLIARLICRLA